MEVGSARFLDNLHNDARRSKVEQVLIRAYHYKDEASGSRMIRAVLLACVAASTATTAPHRRAVGGAWNYDR